MAEVLYFARRAFQYGPNFPGDMLDFDQVVKLRGEAHDERLVRLGFLAQASPGVSIVGCGHCRARFVTDSSLVRHGRLRHSGQESRIQEGETASIDQIIEQTASRAVVPGGPNQSKRDEAAERVEDRKLQDERPLFLDKTAASKKDGAGIPDITTKSAKPKTGRKRKAAGSRQRQATT